MLNIFQIHIYMKSFEINIYIALMQSIHPENNVLNQYKLIKLLFVNLKILYF